MRAKPYDRPKMYGNPSYNPRDKMGVLRGTSYLVHPSLSLEDYPFTRRMNNASHNDKPPYIPGRFGLLYPVSNFGDQIRKDVDARSCQVLHSYENVILPHKQSHQNNKVNYSGSGRIPVTRSSSFTVDRAIAEQKCLRKNVKFNSRGDVLHPPPIQILGSKFPVSNDPSHQFNFTTHAQLKLQNFANESLDRSYSCDKENYECIYPVSETETKCGAEDQKSKQETRLGIEKEDCKSIGKNGHCPAKDNGFKSLLKEKKSSFRRFTTSILPGQLFGSTLTNSKTITAVQDIECNTFTEKKSCEVQKSSSSNFAHPSYTNVDYAKNTSKDETSVPKNPSTKSIDSDSKCSAVPVPAPRTIFSTLRNPLKSGAIWTPRSYRKQLSQNIGNEEKDKRFDDSSGVSKSLVNVSLTNGGRMRENSFSSAAMVSLNPDSPIRVKLAFLNRSLNITSSDRYQKSRNDVIGSCVEPKEYKREDYGDKLYFTPPKLSKEHPHYENIPWITTPIKETPRKLDITLNCENKSTENQHSCTENAPHESSQACGIIDKSSDPSETSLVADVNKSPIILLNGTPPSGNKSLSPHEELSDSIVEVIEEDVDSLLEKTPTALDNKSTPSIGSIWSDRSVNTVLRCPINRSHSFHLFENKGHCKAKRSLFSTQPPDNDDVGWEEISLISSSTTTDKSDSASTKIFNKGLRSSFRDKICSSLYTSPARWYSTWHSSRRRNKRLVSNVFSGSKGGGCVVEKEFSRHGSADELSDSFSSCDEQDCPSHSSRKVSVYCIVRKN